MERELLRAKGLLSAAEKPPEEVGQRHMHSVYAAVVNHNLHVHAMHRIPRAVHPCGTHHVWRSEGQQQQQQYREEESWSSWDSSMAATVVES